MYLCKSLNRKRLAVSQDTIEMKDYKETLSKFDKDYYKKAEWILPGTFGGHGWQAMSYDPKQGLVFIPTMEIVAVHKVKESFSKTGLYKMQPQTVNTGTEFNLWGTVPDMSDGESIPPITGELIAFDPITGEILEKLTELAILPASHYVISDESRKSALKQIEKDMLLQVENFKSEIAFLYFLLYLEDKLLQAIHQF